MDHQHDGKEPDIDRIIHIQEMRRKLEEMGGTFGSFSELPPELEEQFLEQILAYETAPTSSTFQKLEEAGVVLPHPEELSDSELGPKLTELVDALYKQRIVLERTDHLSDRELYEELWHESLREAGPEMPEFLGPGWTHLDILGGCSEEDIEKNLRYYADEKEREDWLQQFPDTVMPPHEDPPFDRDRFLPKANYNLNQYEE